MIVISMPKDMVSAIILAAGESKRMGKPKLLLRFGCSTILERTMDNLLNSNADEIIVVLGYKAQEMKSLIANRPVTTAINPNYHKGMGTSIATGLRVISDRTQGVMLALADQPRVSSQIIDQIIKAFIGHSKGITIPVNNGRRGHPVVFDIKYKSELLRLTGDIGGRAIIDRYPDDILEVDVNCACICTDIDTIADYYVERSRIN
ncbi:molybdenum cofactor cytidylyltransferase [Chloroflexota bacterium]